MQQVIYNLVLFDRVQTAREMHEENIFGRNGDIGLQFIHPIAFTILNREQVVLRTTQ